MHVHMYTVYTRRIQYDRVFMTQQSQNFPFGSQAAPHAAVEFVMLQLEGPSIYVIYLSDSNLASVCVCVCVCVDILSSQAATNHDQSKNKNDCTHTHTI